MMDLWDKVPNNVNLSQNKQLLRVLDAWQPDFLRWWREMGPQGFQTHEVLLRTAISVESSGWAHFDYVRTPQYRWGIFLTPPEAGRTIGFGDHQGQPVWQEVPSDYSDMLRRLLVVQADTEPASIEQQRQLGATAPSLYDLRNLLQVSVEEGRHLWAMVYLLYAYFGAEGRHEVDRLLERRSGALDRPRILEAFNQPVENWLDFFMFTMFTDRVGKFQLHALAESGFDPLSRTCKFMLTEESHHMFVGETGIGRVIERSCDLMNELGTTDPESVRAVAGIPLTMVQRYINLWFSLSEDLFGSESSSNAAAYFASGLKGRYREATYTDHRAQSDTYIVEGMVGDALAQKSVPMRAAMNEVQRDRFAEDCQRAVDKWNRMIESKLGSVAQDLLIRLPHRRFHRQIGIHSVHQGSLFTPEGRVIARADYSEARDRWLPSAEDAAYLSGLMKPVYERGKLASWLTPPARGINGNPFDYQYVRL